MDRNELRQSLLATLPRRDPEVELRNAQRAVFDAECALRSVDGSLATFDRESIYRSGWYESGDQYWRKCETRQTNKCYYAAEEHQSERRFRRADVESDKIPITSYRNYHLGRFVYEDMLRERADRLNALGRRRSELQLIEEQIAEGRPALGGLEEVYEEMLDRLMPEITPPSGIANWMTEGF